MALLSAANFSFLLFISSCEITSSPSMMPFITPKNAVFADATSLYFVIKSFITSADIKGLILNLSKLPFRL